MKNRFWLLIIAMAVPQLAQAATVWTGNDFSFTKASLADRTQEANQDRITADTWLTLPAVLHLISEDIYLDYHGHGVGRIEWRQLLLHPSRTPCA